MRARTAAVAAGAPAGLVALALAFVVGMRTRTPAVVDGVRRANRAVFNPLALRRPARRALARRSSATPVGARGRRTPRRSARWPPTTAS